MTSHKCKDHYHLDRGADFTSWSSGRAEQLRVFLSAHFGEVEYCAEPTAEAADEMEGYQPCLIVRGDGEDEVDGIVNALTLVSKRRCPEGSDSHFADCNL